MPAIPQFIKDANIYNIAVGTYNSSQVVPLVDNCIGYMFTNLGDTIATVNEMIVFPSATPATALGDSRTIMAHKGDIFKGQLKLSIRQPINAAPLVEIVQLSYVDIQTVTGR